jgi:NAD(P)-dependent dehydrogenase (short-subunit alcohol dehydrogenase family)
LKRVLRSGGMTMLVRGMAVEFGPEGIRINGVFSQESSTVTAGATAELVRFLVGQDASYVTGATLCIF